MAHTWRGLPCVRRLTAYIANSAVYAPPARSAGFRPGNSAAFAVFGLGITSEVRHPGETSKERISRGVNNSMNEETAAATAGTGLREILLQPTYFIAEVYSAILPGLVFAFLLFEKRNWTVLAFLSSPSIGYKTKLAVGFAMSYAAGKILGLPFRLVERTYKAIRSTDPDHKKEVARMLPHFLGGLVLPALMGARDYMTYFVIAWCNYAFYSVTGIALLLASAIPGDGDLRLLEFGLGVVLVAAGLIESKKLDEFLLMFLGGATAEWLAGKVSLTRVLALLKAAVNAMESLKDVKQKGGSGSDGSVSETGTAPAGAEGKQGNASL